MPAPRPLIETLGALEPQAFEGIAYRHIAPHLHSLSGAGARMHGGRWNPPNSFATLYLALDLQVVHAEFERMAEKQGRSPQDFLPRHLHRYEIKLRSVLDLTSATTRKRLNITLAEITAEEIDTCQAIGETAQILDIEAIHAPSAATKGEVLAIFTDSLTANSTIKTTGHEIWESNR